jgi:polyhydroxyalkanoate synthesis regulator protein
MKITRYKNRHLYGEGKRWQLEDLIALIKNNKRFQVVTTEGEDITQSILTQCVGKLDLSRETMIELIKDH